MDVFISGEYTFDAENNLEQPLDEMILEKLKNCSAEKKSRVLKMIDLL